MDASNHVSPPSIVCPHCGQVDQVQSVPAVFNSGHSSYQGGGPVVATVGGEVAFGFATHRGTTVTETALGLSPSPVPRRSGCLLAIGLYLLISGVVMGAVGLGTGQAANGLTGLVVVSIPSAAILYIVARRRRRNARVRSGLPAALAVWRCGWFCHRCGGVFFPSNTPFDIPTNQLLPTATFRNLVWKAGGYGSID